LEFGPLWLVALAAPAVLFGPYWAALTSTLGLGGYLAAKLDLTRMPVVVAQVVLAVVAIYAGRLLHDAVPSTIRAGVSPGAGTASWVLFLPFALALGWVGREQGVPRTGRRAGGRGSAACGRMLTERSVRAVPESPQRRGSRWPHHHWRPDGEGLVRGRRRRDTAPVDRLHQLFARSLREIEAHASELAETETGGATIYEAGQLLAALRLWAQSRYRPDQVVREILEPLDLVTLGVVAAELRAVGSPDARVASGIVMTVVKVPTGQRLAIASCALRAL
jgi:hypothetical protein